MYDGLMSYGPNIRSFFTMAADYAARIMKGADPKELPVEQPTTFEFIINLRTARAMGIKIPEQVLLMADQVIEQRTANCQSGARPGARDTEVG